MKTFFTLISIFISATYSQASFNLELHKETMSVVVRLGDSLKHKDVPAPQHFIRSYRSPQVGLDNRFDIWTDAKNKRLMIAIRATTGTPESWLQNMFAGMIPAKGRISLNDSTHFDYHFANHPKAAVHTGWTIGLAAMFPNLKQQIDSLYQAGYKEWIITGYSQGAVIAQYLHAQLHYSKLPQDVVLKKYTTACPRAGNTYFAYDYEAWERKAESYTLVNPHDWVPQTPMSIEFLGDYNYLNPFSQAKKYFKKMKPAQKILVKYLYNQLSKPSKKASKKYRKYLGKFAGKFISKRKSDLSYPEFYPSFHYVRCGKQIVLSNNEDYLKRYPNEGDDVWKHHRIMSYLYLISLQGEEL